MRCADTPSKFKGVLVHPTSVLEFTKTKWFSHQCHVGESSMSRTNSKWLDWKHASVNGSSAGQSLYAYLKRNVMRHQCCACTSA